MGQANSHFKDRGSKLRDEVEETGNGKIANRRIITEALVAVGLRRD